MLNRADKWFLFYLTAAYLAFAEVLSWETSAWPGCLVISNYQDADNRTGNQTCATFHEGIMRGLVFLFDYTTHDNIIAAATVAITAFTLTLWLSSEKTTRLTARMADIADHQRQIARNQTSIQRLQFFATHRPRLIVRGVCLAGEHGLVPDERWKIQIPFTNQGTTDALVRQFAARTFLVEDIVNMNVGNEFHVIDTSGMIPIVSGTHAITGILTDTALNVLDIGKLRQKSLFLMCVGYVQYGDESGGLRVTGFARCLQPNSGRFTPINDPEYEFAY